LLQSDVGSRYTSKERDSESGLDNFGARYLTSSLGRFMSPDPSRESMRLDNPQTWNRYSYVLNNPLELVDPSGELWDISLDIPTWVDQCNKGGTCVETFAVSSDQSSVTVYGAQGANDIAMYSANGDGMIDMRSVSQNPSAEFEVAAGQPRPEEFLNPNAAAGLYNGAVTYHETFPGDSKIVMTAGSTSDGAPAKDAKGRDLHQEHHDGKDADLRYMGPDGKPIKGQSGARQGDANRNSTLAHMLSKSTLTGNPKKYGTVSIRNPKVQAAHQDHMHARDVK
jgi:RHS repeat-associated protein